MITAESTSDGGDSCHDNAEHKPKKHPPLLPGSSSSNNLINGHSKGPPDAVAVHQNNGNQSASHSLIQSITNLLPHSPNHSPNGRPHALSSPPPYSHQSHGETMVIENLPVPHMATGKSVIHEDDLLSDHGLEESEEDYYDLILHKQYIIHNTAQYQDQRMLGTLWKKLNNFFVYEFVSPSLQVDFDKYLFRAYDSGRYLTDCASCYGSWRGNSVWRRLLNCIGLDFTVMSPKRSLKRDLHLLWLAITVVILIPQSILQAYYDFHLLNTDSSHTKRHVRQLVAIVTVIAVAAMAIGGCMLYWSHHFLPWLVSFGSGNNNIWWNIFCGRTGMGKHSGAVTIWPTADSQKISSHSHDIEQPIEKSIHAVSSISSDRDVPHKNTSTSQLPSDSNNSKSKTNIPSSTSFINHNNNRYSDSNIFVSSSQQPLSHPATGSSSYLFSYSTLTTLTSLRLRQLETIFYLSIHVFFVCMFLRVSLGLNTYVSNIPLISSTFRDYHRVIVDIFGGHGGGSPNFDGISRLQSMSTNTALAMMFLIPALLYRLTPHISFPIVSLSFVVSTIIFILVCVSYNPLYFSLFPGFVYASLSWLLMREERVSLMIEFLKIRDNHERLLNQCKYVEDSCDNEMRHLIANVAHDLKTPLTSFMTGIDYIQYSIDDFQIANPNWIASLFSNSTTIPSTSTSFMTKPFMELLESIQNCVMNIQNTNMFMLMIINRCIDYSKVSKGIKLLPRNETVDLIETVLLPLTCMQNIQNKITITLLPLGTTAADSNDQDETKRPNHPPKICTHIITDRLWLQENLLNLLSNAVKYSTSGETTVSISLEGEGLNQVDKENENSIAHHHVKRNEKTRREFSAACLSGVDETSSVVETPDSKPEVQVLPIESKSVAPTLIQSDLPLVQPSNSGSIRFEHSHSTLSPPFMTVPSLIPVAPQVTSSATSSSAINVAHGNSVPATPSTQHSTERKMSITSSLGRLFSPQKSQLSESSSQPPPVAAPKPLLKQASTVGGQPHSNMAQLARSLSKHHGKMHHTQSLPHTTAAHQSKQTAQPTPQIFLRFEVEDTGVGMSDTAMENLFHPFQQTQRFTGGTGLGLFSLSKRIEALGGKYGVSRRRDGKQGSLFWFTIPYRPDEVYADVVAQMKDSDATQESERDGCAFVTATVDETNRESDKNNSGSKSIPHTPTHDSNRTNGSSGSGARGGRNTTPSSTVRVGRRHQSTLLSSFSKEEQNEVFQAVRDAVRNTMTKVSFASSLQSFSVPSSTMSRSSVLFSPTSQSGQPLQVVPVSAGHSFSSANSGSNSGSAGGITPTNNNRPFQTVLPSVLGSHSGDRSDRYRDKDRDVLIVGHDRGKSIIFSTIEEVATPTVSVRGTPVVQDSKRGSLLAEAANNAAKKYLQDDSESQLESHKPTSVVADKVATVGPTLGAVPTKAESPAQEVAATTSITPDQAAVKGTIPPKRKESLTSLNVLVVDDSPAILKMCSMMIKKLGHRTSTAENGEIAVQLCIDEREKKSHVEPSESNGSCGFDVILMDLQMPVLDGLEATKRIRQLVASSTASRCEFIIGFSANSDIETQEAALSAGMDIFMPKPFNVANFISAIAHLNT